MNALDVISGDRREQLEDPSALKVEDGHLKGEMVKAAQCYLTLVDHQVNRRAPFVKKLMETVPKEWPWDPNDWNPSLIAKNNLRKAGALIVGEWDRLDRLGF